MRKNLGKTVVLTLAPDPELLSPLAFPGLQENIGGFFVLIRQLLVAWVATAWGLVTRETKLLLEA